MTTPVISIVKFTEPVQIGPEAAVEEYLTQGKVLTTYRLTFDLDQTDSRFLLITGTHTVRPKEQFFQWVPLERVSTLLLNGKPLPANKK